nr:hypothetical protein Iba_chr11cCG0200 [Ipomoea batatas]
MHLLFFSVWPLTQTPECYFSMPIFLSICILFLIQQANQDLSNILGLLA